MALDCKTLLFHAAITQFQAYDLVPLSLVFVVVRMQRMYLILLAVLVFEASFYFDKVNESS